MSKVSVAREYRKQYPDKPTRALAKLMYKENNLLFENEESARERLRYIEGKSGKRAISNTVRESEFFKEEARPANPYKLPEPDSQDLEPYKLPTAWNDFIFASDFHLPNHRKEPINAMIKYAQENNIKKLMIGGDLLDNTPFTRWMREPLDKGDVRRWFDMAKEFLRYLKTFFDEIIWIEGNHDFWYKRYLMQKAPELFGDPYFELEQRLDLNTIGIKFITQNYLVKAGKLNIHHGHITFRGGGSYANAARMLYMKTKSNMLCGHVHVESSHTEPDINDEICTTFTVGCMTTLRPEYQPFGGKACHGFARIKVKPNRDFNVFNFRIYKGEIM
jgi:UDP-2,3-diacylglucosamine pyrophosphatase LpxH